jgi:tRNA-splicing ligase RtcB
MIHSGSRNLGYKVANYYHNKALEFCTLHNIELPDDNLAFLLTDSELGKEYIAAMRYCQWFATENRQTMLNKFYSIVEDITCCDFIGTQIDVPHNYAIEEHIESEKDLVWIHRKGAIRVDPLSKGIIPGSMGTNSYIIAGKENKDSFNSSSHGAGRNMGRSEFNKTHTVDECDQAMKGIVFGRWGKNRKGKVDLSEAPQAYKNIKDVMKDQEDLVDILVALTPLGCMKG